MTRVQTLLGPQVTELYEKVLAKIDTLRAERRRINNELKDLVAEEIELRKYVRLFDPVKIRPPQKRVEDGDEQ
jgi:hypothetical protein